MLYFIVFIVIAVVFILYSIRHAHPLDDDDEEGVK
jgi:hypothetical protein